MPNPPIVRIFFSSPGDVKMERETARRIVERLQAELGPRASLEPYFWEHEVMVATKDYQQNIPAMDGFDVVVCILWSRLGSPLHPERHPRPDGGYFESGTEYEFFMAMQAHRAKGAPDVLVFKNRTEPRRPSRPKEAREAVDREIDRLDQFFERYFRTGEYYTAAVNSYRTLGEFEDKLTQGLRGFLDAHLPAPGPRTRRVAAYSGRPYLGLAAFDFGDAPVFFGRTAQIGQVIEAFQAQELEARAAEDEGKRFVLVLGASGSGKSSLARAGVLPMLVQPGVIEGAEAWRRAIVKPGAAGGDPFLALAGALLAPEALPELGSDGTDAVALAGLLRRQPGAVGLLLRQALSQAGAAARAAEVLRLEDRLRKLENDQREDDARELRERLAKLAPPAVRLALLVDQLEELFTTDQAGDVTAAFVECLAAVARSGRVFVLGTLRSDFYASCLAHPKLVELMRGSGSYALPAPGPAELGQMIRQPAAAAGLAFEENAASGEKLDELLRDAALLDPAALPLLGYTLEQLYEKRTAEGVLTLAAYRALGGLEGAIGKRAEEVFTALPGDAQAAFDRVLRQLVTLGDGGAAVRRRTPYRALSAGAGARALVDALVSARLFTADQDAGGERTISVVHEALLRHWPRVVQWVEENRDFLRARSRLAARLAEWLEQKQDEHFLIPPGPPLGEAESILSRFVDALDPAEVDFVRRSTVHARARDQARARRNRRITIGAVSLSALALVGGGIAWRERGVAEAERATAVAQKLAAEKSARAALASQTRAAYLLGIEMLEGGKTRDGLTSLAQALALDPEHVGARNRLYSYHLYGLPKAISVRSVAGPEGVRQRVSGSVLGPSRLCAYLDPRGAPEVFDLRAQRVIEGGWQDERGTVAAILNNSSSHLMCLHEGLRCRIWPVAGGGPSAWLTVDGAVDTLNLSEDGRWLVEGGLQGLVRVWDVAQAKPVHEWTQSARIEGVQFDPTHELLATVGGEVVFFDLARGMELGRVSDPEWSSNSLRIAETGDVCVVAQRSRSQSTSSTRFVFVQAGSGQPWADARVIPISSDLFDFALNRDGTELAVASFVDTADVYDRTDAARDRRFEHATYPVLVKFSPDGRLLLTASSDGTVRIWDAESRALVFEPINHDGRLEDMLVSWDGRFLLSSTGRRARVWDLAVGRALTLPLTQNGSGFCSVFDSTGETLWTASADSGFQAWNARSLERKGPAILAGRGLSGALVDGVCTRALALLPDRGVVVLDLAAGKQVAEPWSPPEGALLWSLSDDNSRAAVAAGDVMTFLDTTTGRALARTWHLPEAPSGMRMSFDGRRVAALVGGGTHVLVHDIDSGIDATLDGAATRMQALRFSPDGRWLAVGASGMGTAVEHGALIWDLRSSTAPPRKIAHDDVILDLRFSPDGRWLATGTKGQIAQVWSVESGRAESNPIFLSRNVVRGVLFGPDSRLLAVHCGDATIRVYDWREACPVSQVLDVRGNLTDFCFSPDGTRLVTCAPDPGDETKSHALVWEVAPHGGSTLDLVALTEAATALHVSKDGLPIACDPFEGWNRLRSAQPDLWFFQSPALRSISPAFTASSLRWIKDESVGVQQTGLAMPAVAMVRAAMSYWSQENVNARIRKIQDADPTDPAVVREIEDLRQRQRTVDALAESASRSASEDAATCLWLSLQKESAGDMIAARQYVDDAQRLAPEDREILRQASDVYLGVNDCEAERNVLLKLRALEPEVVKHRGRLGYNGWRCGDRDLARREFAAVVDDPSITPRDRAEMLACLGRHKEALAAWSAMADEEKTGGRELTEARIATLIIGHQLVGETDAAVSWFVKLIAREPNAADPEVIGGVSSIPELGAALAAALAATLERHPELRVKAH